MRYLLTTLILLLQLSETGEAIAQQKLHLLQSAETADAELQQTMKPAVAAATDATAAVQIFKPEETMEAGSEKISMSAISADSEDVQNQKPAETEDTVAKQILQFSVSAVSETEHLLQSAADGQARAEPFSEPEETEPGTKMTLDQVIQIGLENNYGIQIFRNTTEIASNNRTLGNAGFLPSLGIGASRTERVEDSRFQTGDTGEISENLGARSTGSSAGVSMNWTLFDGMNMFILHEKLGELEDLGKVELRFQVEATVQQIIDAYVVIIRINEQLEMLENSVELSRERIEIAETKLDLGSGSQYELLQARTDFNADRAAVLREQNQLVEAKIMLNELIARDVEADFEVAEDIAINRNLAQEDLHRRMMEDNTSLQLARIEQRVAQLEMREIRSERYPEIELNGGYNLNRTEATGGFFRLNETEGFNVGVTARIPIFDGFNTSRRVQNAKINQRNSQLQLEEQLNRVNAVFLSAYRAYENSLELVDLEEENLDHARGTLDIALERFRLGTISALEFREAQRTFLAAESRLIDAKYEAKIAETELLRLSGDLQHVSI